MRFAVLVCVLTLLASPYFFAYYDAERLLGWPQAAYLWIDPWLPIVMILVAALTAFALPWIVSLFCDRDHRL